MRLRSEGPGLSADHARPPRRSQEVGAGGASERRAADYGGPLQQVSNGAFYKNSRAALRKLDRPPRTAKNTPGLSEKDRYGKAKVRGQDGNPKSKAKNFVSVTLP